MYGATWGCDTLFVFAERDFVARLLARQFRATSFLQKKVGHPMGDQLRNSDQSIFGVASLKMPHTPNSNTIKDEGLGTAVVNAAVSK